MADTRKQILLVSTAADLRQRIGKLLGQVQGYTFQLTEADTAFRALDIAAKGKINCLIVDFAALDQTPEAFMSALTGAGAPPAVLALVDRAEASTWTSSPHDRGVQGVLTRDETDERILAYGIMCAMQQKQSERMVYEQMLLVKAILTGAPGLLALKNASLEYQAANTAFCQFIGKSPEEIVGKTDFDLFPAEYAEAYRREDQRVMRSFVPRTDDVEMVGDEGPRWMNVSRSPIFDPDGETAGILLFANDITELKEMAHTAQEVEAKVAAARAESQPRISDLEGKLAETSQQLENLRIEFESVRSDGSNAAAQLSQLQAEVEEQRLAASAAKTAAENAQAELAALQTQQAGLNAQAAALVRERDQAVEALAACEKRIAESSDQTGAMESRLESTQNRVSELETALAESEARANAAAEKMAHLKSAVSAAEEARDTAKRESDALDAKCAETEGKLTDARTQLEETTQRITLLGEEKAVMESTLAMREVAYQAAFDAAACALCEVGAGTRVMNANPAALALFECDEADVDSGTINLIDLVAADAKAEAAEYLKACLGEPAVPARKISMTAKSGRPFTALVKCAVLRNGSKPTGLIVSLLDASSEDRLGALRELAEQADELAKALRKAAE